MDDSWFGTMISGKTTEGDAITATTLNVTKVVSFIVAIFAGITQWLSAENIVKLSTTQMVTIWLVVAGLIVLLSITDMICRAYVTAKRYGSGEASLADLNLSKVKVQKQGERRPQEAKLLGILTGGSGQFAHVEWTDVHAPDDKKDRNDAWVPLDEVQPF